VFVWGAIRESIEGDKFAFVGITLFADMLHFPEYLVMDCPLLFDQFPKLSILAGESIAVGHSLLQCCCCGIGR